MGHYWECVGISAATKKREFSTRKRNIGRLEWEYVGMSFSSRK